jgi:hypothetical protein
MRTVQSQCDADTIAGLTLLADLTNECSAIAPLLDLQKYGNSQSFALDLQYFVCSKAET